MGASVLLLTSLLLVVRVHPREWGDNGIFLSVGARLLEGDRLYADVADNKDPLFYYTYAAALWIGDWRAPALLDGFWLALAGLAMGLLVRELRAGTLAMFAGAVLYPLALTASWYEPATSMLAALALAPTAAWLWLRDRSALAGVALGVAVLFKANLALVVVAPIAALLLMGAPANGRGRRFARAAAGGLGAMSAAALFLAVRGELGPYIDIVRFNVDYADEGLVTQGGTGSVTEHLSLIPNFLWAAGKWQPSTAAGLVALGGIALLVAWVRARRELGPLAAVTATTSAAAVLTVALTALFNSHLQMLALPVVLGAALVVAVADRMLGRVLATLVAAVLVALGLSSSLKHDGLMTQPWIRDPISVPGSSLRSARATLPSLPAVTYAVFGRNSENGHAAFAGDGLTLACPWFHQYPFHKTQLVETLACVEDERPTLVLVTPGFYDPIDVPRWQRFVSGARRTLAGGYERVLAEQDVEVWRVR